MSEPSHLTVVALGGNAISPPRGDLGIATIGSVSAAIGGEGGTSIRP